MGYYLEVPVNSGKAEAIVRGDLMVQASGDPSSVMDKFSPSTAWAFYRDAVGPYQAGMLDKAPASFADVPEGKALVCVAHNAPFEAACFVYDEREFAACTDPSDPRQRDWLLVDKDAAVRASGIPASRLA